MNMLLAQSASLDGAMSEGLGIIAKVPLHHRGHRHRPWRLAGAKRQRRHGQDVHRRRPASRPRCGHRRRSLSGGRDANDPNRDDEQADRSRPTPATTAMARCGGSRESTFSSSSAGLLLSVGLSLDALPAADALDGVQLRCGLAPRRARLRLRLRAPAGQAAFLRHRSSRDPSRRQSVAAAASPATPPDSSQ